MSASSWGPSKKSFSLLYKAFLRPLLTYVSPGLFPFLSVTNITKLKGLHWSASRAITGCLSSSHIPLLLSDASTPSLRVTLTHFALLSFDRALPSHFRFGQTLSETKTLQIVLESFCVHSPANAFFDISSGDSPCLPSLSSWVPALHYCGVHPFLSMLSLMPLFLAKVRRSPTLTVSHLTMWYSGQKALFLFFLTKLALGYVEQLFR